MAMAEATVRPGDRRWGLSAAGEAFIPAVPQGDGGAVGAPERPAYVEAPDGTGGYEEAETGGQQPAAANGAWLIGWPQGSWEDGHGREMIASARAGDGVPGAFVVGLGADPEWSWLVYDGEGSGFPAGGLERDHLRELEWRHGQAIVVVARRREGDGLEALLAELGEAVGADIWYPGDGAALRLTPEGRRRPCLAGGGAPADLWRRHESRSLRESSGIRVPAWLEVSDEGVLVPAAPAGGFFSFGFRDGWASVGPADLAGCPSWRGSPSPGCST